MAYYKPIKLVKGDDLPELEIVLRDSNVAGTGQTLDITDPTTWNPIDLTNVTAAKLKFREIDTLTPLTTILFTRIAPYTDGRISLQWGLTDLDITGDYEAEIELTYSSGRVMSVPDLLKFDIRSDF